MTAPAEEATKGRVERGMRLFAERLGEFVEKHSGVVLVPGSRGATYTVRIAGEEEYCSCPDHSIRESACKHIIAVGYMRAVTEPCEGCGRRVPNGDLREVVESLTYFEGQRICEWCWHGSASEVV